MTKNVKEILKELQTDINKMKTDIPDILNPFVDIIHGVHKDGAISTKFKELICMTISVHTHCDACIAAHTKNAREAGATYEEIMEACACAILMGGGPSISSISLVLRTLEAFS